MTSPRLQEYLTRFLKLHPKRIDLSLGRIEKLLKKLNHPEKNCPPIIHVAGTNGKGSTVAFVRSILNAANYRTHIYTSPHLVRFNERIRINDHFITDDELIEIFSAVEKINAGDLITYFEITTAAALIAFAKHPADFLILETGLGGTFDATNIFEQCAAAIITAIGQDHADFLGTDILKIAREKAGIFKPHCPAIIAAQQTPAIAQTLVTAAREKNATPIKTAGVDFTTQSGDQHWQYNDLILPLPALTGTHQINNAAAAIAALTTIPDLAITPNHIATGLQTTNWPGRFHPIHHPNWVQTLPDHSEIWLDGGHNPSAATAIQQTLSKMSEKPLYIIYAGLRSKDTAGFFEKLGKNIQFVHAVPIQSEQAARTSQEIVEEVTRLGIKARADENVQTALQTIATHTKTPCRVVICGSLYLAGHVLAQTEDIPA